MPLLFFDHGFLTAVVVLCLSLSGYFASKYDYHLCSWNYLFPLGIISAIGTYNTVMDNNDVYSFWFVLIFCVYFCSQDGEATL